MCCVLLCATERDIYTRKGHGLIAKSPPTAQRWKSYLSVANEGQSCGDSITPAAIRRETITTKATAEATLSTEAELNSMALR